MHSAPLTYAASRRSTLADIESYPTLTVAWLRTQHTLAQIQTQLMDAALPSNLLTVAASGSLGRMEQLGSSDADLIVVLRDSPTTEVMRTTFDEVRTCIAPLCLPLPEPGGIFDHAITHDALVSSENLGQIDESPTTFGKRIQLLLDAQPVFNPQEFERLQAKIVARYLTDSDLHKTDAWNYLLDDLIRYFRCLSINSKWKHRGAPQKRENVRIKFGHSRRLLYAGLLLLLGESTVKRSTPMSEWLLSHLKLTPLERVSWVYQSRGDTNFSRIGGCYEKFLATMADRKPNRVALHPNAAEFAAELSRFTFQQDKAWDPDFVHRLLF